jgi:hypothetical protein
MVVSARGAGLRQSLGTASLRRYTSVAKSVATGQTVQSDGSLTGTGGRKSTKMNQYVELGPADHAIRFLDIV